MRFHSISLTLKFLAPAAVALMLASCGPDHVGQYSEAKQDWDSAPTVAELDDMRHRAYYTQRDH